MIPKQILINKDKCSGCRLCETQCAFRFYEEVNAWRSKIRIKKKDTIGEDIPVVCRQCPRPACVSACPNKALYQDNETGVILLNIEKCDGTGACVNACPYHAAWIDPITRKVLICNQCGGDPECVKWCFSGAILYEEKSDPKRKGLDVVKTH